jgi:hypothetical protein
MVGGALVNVHTTSPPGGGVTVMLAPPVTRLPSGKTHTLEASQVRYGSSVTVYERSVLSQGLVLRSRCFRMKFGPQPLANVNGICVGSTVGPGVVSCIILITAMRPRIELTNVQVSVSPGRTSSVAVRAGTLTETEGELCELVQVIPVLSHIEPVSPSETT